MFIIEKHIEWCRNGFGSFIHSLVNSEIKAEFFFFRNGTILLGNYFSTLMKFEERILQ